MDEQLEYNKDAGEIAKWYVQLYNKVNETAAQHENKGECDRQIGLRWPNTVLARALANAIQRAHKYCIKTNMA